MLGKAPKDETSQPSALGPRRRTGGLWLCGVCTSLVALGCNWIQGNESRAGWLSADPGDADAATDAGSKEAGTAADASDDGAVSAGAGAADAGGSKKAPRAGKGGGAAGASGEGGAGASGAPVEPGTRPCYEWRSVEAYDLDTEGREQALNALGMRALSLPRTESSASSAGGDVAQYVCRVLDRSPTWVGRGNRYGCYIAGLAKVGDPIEPARGRFEVLLADEGCLSWRALRDDKIPDKAFSSDDQHVCLTEMPSGQMDARMRPIHDRRLGELRHEGAGLGCVFEHWQYLQDAGSVGLGYEVLMLGQASTPDPSGQAGSGAAGAAAAGAGAAPTAGSAGQEPPQPQPCYEWKSVPEAADENARLAALAALTPRPFATGTETRGSDGAPIEQYICRDTSNGEPGQLGRGNRFGCYVPGAAAGDMVEPITTSFEVLTSAQPNDCFAWRPSTVPATERLLIGDASPCLMEDHVRLDDMGLETHGPRLGVLRTFNNQSACMFEWYTKTVDSRDEAQLTYSVLAPVPH